MDRALGGDAVAFSIDLAPPRSAFRVHRNRTTVPLCLLRVDRRRSDRYAWDRVMDELVEVRPHQLVSRLERHRYEYRLALHKCSDPWILPLPSALHVARIYGGMSYEHPHVGTFRFVKMQQSSQPTTTHETQASSWSAMWPAVAIIGVLVVCALLLMKFKEAIVTLGRTATLALRACARRASRASFSHPLNGCVDSLALMNNGARDAAVSDDFDDENDKDRDIGKELLMTELPDFNDETGWRDFFDSQIYQRDDRQQQTEGVEGSRFVRQQRKLITRSCNPVGTKKSDKTKSVTPQAKRSIYSSPDPVQDKIGDGIPARGSNSSVVSSVSNLSSLQLPTPNILSETTGSAISDTHSMGSKTSRTTRPTMPPDDFGEFWQM